MMDIRYFVYEEETVSSYQESTTPTMSDTDTESDTDNDTIPDNLDPNPLVARNGDFSEVRDPNGNLIANENTVFGSLPSSHQTDAGSNVRSPKSTNPQPKKSCQYD